MIDESTEWRNAIKRNNSYIRRFAKIATKENSTFPPDRIHMRIITNALFCRKLLETPMVASEFKQTNLPVSAHPWNDSIVDHINAHKIDEKYRLETASTKILKAPVLGNYIIHSFIWAWGVDEELNIDSFLVCSDKTREKDLYRVDLRIYLDFLQSVANSYPARCVMNRDPVFGQWQWDADTPN